MTRRPTGKRLMMGGAILFLAGLAAFVMHGLANGFFPNDQYPIEHWTQYVAVWAPPIFTVCIPLGVLAWLTGYLAFAISFIPSRDDPNAQN